MLIKPAKETVFGNEVCGIELRMSHEEADLLMIVVGQTLAHPPQIGINTNYDATHLAATIIAEIRRLLNE